MADMAVIVSAVPHPEFRGNFQCLLRTRLRGRSLRGSKKRISQFRENVCALPAELRGMGMTRYGMRITTAWTFNRPAVRSTYEASNGNRESRALVAKSAFTQ